MTSCQICNRAIDHDFNLAVSYCRGVRESVPVHKRCIDHHDRKMAREAFLNTTPEMRGGMFFREWYGTYCGVWE